MSNKASNNSCGLFLLFFIIVALLAWITYGTLEGVLGFLSFILLSIICIFPWVIPFAGIPLGILDILGFYSFEIYNTTLSVARLKSSWMTILWYWIIAIIGIIIDLILSILIIFKIKGLKKRKKEPKTDIALIHCNIIDGNLDSEVITDGIILIKNIVKEGETAGLISGIGKASDIKIPSTYKKVDLKNQYVLPGLINAHCHLTMGGKPTKLVTLSDEIQHKLIKILDTSLGKMVVNKMMIKNARNALNSGVTTLRTMGDPLFLDVKLRKKIESCKIIGPRLLVAGTVICITGGHGGLMGQIADSIPEIRKAIRQNLRKEVDLIKIISTGGVMDARKLGEAGRPQMTVEEIETACIEAHRGGLMVATHCESTKGIEEALKAGVDTIEHGANIPDNFITLFKDNPKTLRGYTSLIPTLSAGMGLSTLPLKNTKITPIMFENAKLIEKGMIDGLRIAYKNNIKFGCGTDAGVPYSTHYEVWKELKYYLEYTDMSAQEAIYVATKNTAEIIGVDDITGSIEVGKSADLQVVQGNPLEDLNNLGKVTKVLIQGHLINNPKIKKAKKLEKTPLNELLKC